jgi:AcrR family transcriptional regulator
MLKHHLSIQENDTRCLNGDSRRQWVMVHHGGPTADPRIRRTRQLLQRALDKLMEQKDFNDISVQDIADESTVNRATFYDHYADKYALLACTVAARFQELVKERDIRFEGGCAGQLKNIALAVCDYLVKMQGAHCERQLEPHMESAIIGSVRAILLAGIQQHSAAGSVRPELMAASASWAIYGAAKEWIETPERCPAEEIADTVTSLVSPMLRIP